MTNYYQITSDKEKADLLPGESYEKYITLNCQGRVQWGIRPSDITNYQMEMGFLHLEVFSETGSRIGSSEGFGGMPMQFALHFLGELTCKVKVSRSDSDIQNRLGWVVTISGDCEANLSRLGQK